MTIRGLHHLVLRIPDLGEAESFYRDLFDLDVLFREGSKDGEFGALPDGLDWEAATEKGVEPGMSFLGRDEFALALMEDSVEQRPTNEASGRRPQAESASNAEAGRLDHLALELDADDRDAIRDRAADLDCEFEAKSHAVFVTDRYGVEWELNASSPPPETPFDPLGL